MQLSIKSAVMTANPGASLGESLRCHLAALLQEEGLESFVEYLRGLISARAEEDYSALVEGAGKACTPVSASPGCSAPTAMRNVLGGPPLHATTAAPRMLGGVDANSARFEVTLSGRS